MKSRCTLLTREQETELAHQLPSQAARDRLFESCWPYVLKQARRFRNHKVGVQELAQVGAVGLLRAIEKFDATKGARLLTYAAPWVIQELTRYVSASQHIVRLDTSPQLIAAKSLVRQGKASTPEELADETGLPEELAARVMHTLAVGDVPLAHMNGQDVDLDSRFEMADDLLDELRTARRVRAAVSALPAAQRRVVELVHLRGASFPQAAHALGCSHQNVRSRVELARVALVAHIRYPLLDTLAR